MTSEHDEAEEGPLQELFEATAEQASGTTLTRLAARAADVPDQVGRRRSWLPPSWVWAPVAAGLGAVIALVTLGAEPNASESSVATGPNSDEAMPAPRMREPRQGQGDAELVELLEPVATDWDANAPTPQGALDVLYGPPVGADLDAWLFATSELLDNEEQR